jgi:hypothetical protein
MSLAKKGKSLSEEHKRNIGLSLIGNKNSSGKHLTVEHKGKLSKSLKGRIISEEHRKRISESLKGNVVSEETKKKLREINLGKKYSEETRRKMSESRKYSRTEEEQKRIGDMMKGEKNPAWNGGSSFLPYSSEWTNELKQFIMKRDGFKCQNPYCYHKNTVLNVHHIDYNKKNCGEYNLITLCSSCNCRANANRGFWGNLYNELVWGRYSTFNYQDDFVLVGSMDDVVQTNQLAVRRENCYARSS